jgi:hypothetical protein
MPPPPELLTRTLKEEKKIICIRDHSDQVSKIGPRFQNNHSHIRSHYHYIHNYNHPGTLGNNLSLIVAVKASSSANIENPTEGRLNTTPTSKLAILSPRPRNLLFCDNKIIYPSSVVAVAAAALDIWLENN